MLHVIVCDPSKEFVLQAAQALKERIAVRNMDACIARISLAPEGVKRHLNGNGNIHYAVMNLMFRDVALNVRESNRESYIVFSTEQTAQIHLAFEGLARPSGIHIKPVDRREIADLFESAYSDYMLLDRQDDCLSVSFGAQMHRIRYDDILYFEAAEKKLFVVTKAQRIGFYGTLEALGKSIPENRFLRVHKGFIVNRNRIREVDWRGMTVRLSDRDLVPISRTHKNSVREAVGDSLDG